MAQQSRNNIAVVGVMRMGGDNEGIIDSKELKEYLV